MKFSARTPSDLIPNRLTTAIERMREGGVSYLDLTLSNPTRAELHYDPSLLAPLSDAAGLRYSPTPFGLTNAREAVAEDFARRGHTVSVDRIALTASTSEAYSLLFKLLCDSGDEVLVPRPSYPLFEHLTRLDEVVAVPYDLEYHGRWTVDRDSVERALTSRARAILIVNPNNPTGSFVSPDELDELGAICAARDIALISDEVFADYALAPGAAAGSLIGRTDVAGFTMGGLSKSVGLPQVKLAWIALSGSAAHVDAVRGRLELIADTYLSVSTPVQVAAPRLLRDGASVREQIQSRICANYARLQRTVGQNSPCRLLHADAGWSAVLQVPSIVPEEELVLTLLTEERVLVHPGYFFDFARESFLIVSLLTPEADFADGIARLLRRVEPPPA